MRDERGPVGWQPATSDATIRALTNAGITGDQMLVAIQELLDAGVLVKAGYYVPSSGELMDQYHMLGEAYLLGRINVRWVMCAETRDALMERYARTRYPRTKTDVLALLRESPPGEYVLETEVAAVMERKLTWSGYDRLFDIPIRVDPVARRPVFEIIPEEERDRG